MKAIKIGTVIFCCAGVMWSEPVVLQEGVAFHKMKIDPNASKDDPACMQCHVHTMKSDPASDPASDAGHGVCWIFPISPDILR